MPVLARGKGLVSADAGRIDLELEPCPVVVIGVQGDGEPVRVHEEPVSPAEASGDGAPVGEDGTHVECFVVIEDEDLGFFGGRFALKGIQLSECRRWNRPEPGIFIQDPVQVQGPFNPGGLYRGDPGTRRRGCGWSPVLPSEKRSASAHAGIRTHHRRRTGRKRDRFVNSA